METSIFSTMASDTSTFIPVNIANAEGMPIWNMMFLVFEAIAEVVCVSLPGFILAKFNMFDDKAQKSMANINISLFTPCLIFTKLGNQLEVKKLVELGIIPVIWALQLLVSWFCAVCVSKWFRFSPRAKNFVIAMAVFGNSSSLPMSLIISLSMTISGLHWDKIPGDNDGQVAARGILYLLIFQQLGQTIRWSWGSEVLLRKRKIYEEYDDGTPSDFRRIGDTKPLVTESHSIEPPDASVGLLLSTAKDYGTSTPNKRGSPSEAPTVVGSPDPSPPPSRGKDCGIQTTLPKSLGARLWESQAWKLLKKYMNIPLAAMLVSLIVAVTPFLKRLFFTPDTFVNNSVTRAISQSGNVAVPLILVVLGGNLAEVEPKSINPQDITESQLVYREDAADPPTEEDIAEARERYIREFEEAKARANDPRVKRHFNNLVAASLISRMVLPFMILFPMLALAAKYMQISVLDDPIFVVVCCLLAGSPTALQMGQICGMNMAYEKVNARVMFWSYVVFILPVTMINVIGSLKIVEWAR